MDMNEARIKKIYELAMNGIDGEKETAQALLNKLLKKYNLSLDETIENNDVSEYFYKFHNTYEKTILGQVFYKITNSIECYTKINQVTGRQVRSVLGVRCTAAQKAEIDLLYDFYCTLWEKEAKALMFAFIHKHKIFGDSTVKDEYNPSQEEMDKLLFMMQALSNESPHLRIEEKRNDI